MKLFKRIFSAFMSVIMVFGIVTMLVSCSSSKDKTASLNVGEYLSELANAFGMYSYTSKEPHVSGVNKDNEYFDTVQTCFEWNVIDGSDIDLDNSLTKSFVAKTLIKAVRSEDIEKKDDKEIAKIASDKGYITFKYKGTSDTEKTVTDEEARESIKASVKIWASPTQEESKSEATFGENTVNLTGLKSDDIIYGNDGTVAISKAAVSKLDGAATTGDERNTMTGGKSGSDSIKDGVTYVLPATENKSATAYTASSVIDDGNYYIIKNEQENPDIETTIQELHESGTTDVDFSKAVITCGDGVVLSNEGDNQNVSLYEKPQVGYIGTDVHGAETEDTAVKGFSRSFTVGNVGVSLTVGDGGNSIGFGINVKMGEKENVSVSSDYTLSNVRVENDIDINWFKLKYAKCILGYELEESKKASVTFVDKDLLTYSGDYSTVTKPSGLTIGKFSHALRTASGKTKGHTSIKICSIDLASIGVASVSFDVKVNLTIEGYIELSVVTKDAKGLEYANKNLRTVNEHTQEESMKFGGKAELTLYAGVAANLLGVEAIGFGAKIGIGIAASIKATLTDSENHMFASEVYDNVDETSAESLAEATNGKTVTLEGMDQVTLKMDICLDLSAYKILSIEVSNSCLLVKLTDKLSFEIWGSDDTFWKCHKEKGKEMSSCSKTYAEIEIEDEEESTTAYDVNKSDTIEISDFALDMAVGESRKLTVEAVPQEYELSDLKFSSDNTGVATIDSNGNVTGVSEGNANITVSTSDGKYSAKCSIFVY
ncbi:MAG: Ig-like domain-containing protein [Acutalibacteraceae bacterium]